MSLRILLIGASGAVGRRVAAELARSDGVGELLVAGRRKPPLTRLADMLGGRTTSVIPAPCDVQDEDGTKKLMRGADVAISCAGPSFKTEVPALRAVMDAGVPYLSLNDDASALAEVSGLAANHGAPVVSGCGMSPGISNWLIAAASARLEHVSEVEITVAASSADTLGPASAEQLVYAFSRPARFLSDGTEVTSKGGSSPKLVYFPEPVGWTETFRAGHPEVATLPSLYPSLRSVQYRVGLTERAAMDVVRAGAALGLSNTERTRGLLLRATSAARPLLERMPPRGPAWTGLRVDVHGRRDGREETVSLGVVDHLLNLASVPIALAAIELGKKGAAGSGPLDPERAFDPKTMLAAVMRRGLRVARLEAQLV